MSTVLLLRTCKADGSSYGGFLWPLEVGAIVTAPDWNPEPACGGGLHGLPWAVGDATLMDCSPSAKGIVFEADAGDIVDIDGAKSKARAGVIRFVGTLNEAAAWLDEKTPNKSTAGYRGTATAGDGGTATAGYRGTATAGDGGTATAGYGGTATAGYGGTATAGYRGTATAGDGGTATAGYRGTATAGYGGVICILRWNGKRYKIATATVKDEDGEGQLTPNIAYRLNEAGEFVEAK